MAKNFNLKYNKNDFARYHSNQVNNSIIKLISTIVLVFGGGVTATWYFSTSETLSRPLRDNLGMLTLFICFLVAAILIVIIIIRTDTN